MVQVGDTLVTIVTVVALVREEPSTYTMTFTDLPTGVSESLFFTWDGPAMECLAAWIAADDLDRHEWRFGVAERLNSLREKKLFLP